MTEYAARVYDLDGTLVRLAVDWDDAAADARDALRDAGVDVPADADAWATLDLAYDRGLGGEVNEAIAAHEREGAANSRRLELADEPATASVPVAVCSLNCEEACRIALDTHDLLEHVDAVIGRDTVDGYKPDPAPLLAAARALETDPADALFVGDSERDEDTARRAGMPFEYVGDGPRTY